MSYSKLFKLTATLVAGAIILTGCNAIKQNNAPVENTPPSQPVDTTATQTTQTKPINGEVSAAFSKVSVKTIFDRLAAVRAKKNMKLKTRNKTQLTMALALPKQSGKPKEEVRITYTAQTKGSDTLIVAKAYRVTNPDSFDEKTEDLTKQLSVKLQEELSDVQSQLR
ncbi:hypothetical protein LIN78_05485 [Leeia sp. TBRC 13508]|uniref:Lipoprotein n=1 Tax=Leeia speluncae TaxID=2884804 RepID=A0ABS8D465_9NEIS|nr:hypothetical protein [Leeia speluncae]MCB6182999.1 hypothetical protein [Leeia speluncae]